MSFFKAYDMRGTFGVDFDLDLVRSIGQALPRVVKGRKWLIGRDCRLSSEQMRDALVEGLVSAGAMVVDLGLATTSMVYFFTGEDDFDGSVMITASHNPPSDNGLKVSCRSALPVSYASGLKEVEALLARGERLPQIPGGIVDITMVDSFRARYLKHLKALQAAGEAAISSLRFAVDCSNGMSSLFARELFPQAVIINEVRDGHFPAHSPNPLKPEARTQLAATVREMELDCGVIFDGDADRAMFVDEHGDFVQPDYLIPLIARETAAATGNANRKVLHDIRTSRGAIETLREQGFEPIMVPVGPALAKPMMRESGAVAGGELAGHYYFPDFHGCDSGLLAAIRVLGAVGAAKKNGNGFSDLMAPVLNRYANSGELNYKVEDKDAAIARVLVTTANFGLELGRSEIDGVRVEFSDGWVNVRKSNTEPYLRLLVEHRSQATLAKWIASLEGAIQC